jgi:hypothetical protein
MFGAGVTIHLSIPELIIVAVVLGFSAIRELMHLARANGEEVLEFLRWWAKFRHDVRQALRTAPPDAPPEKLRGTARRLLARIIHE